MLLKEEINKYLNYCKFQKELDDKTIKAYKADLEQFITVIGENNPDKEVLNAYLVYLHRMYKQKTVKRKIASVKALFHYLEEEELIEINPFHKVKTKFREEVILPKIIPRDIIEQLLNHLYNCLLYTSTLSQFFCEDGNLIELTDEEKELISRWKQLSAEQRLSLIHIFF